MYYNKKLKYVNNDSRVVIYVIFLSVGFLSGHLRLNLLLVFVRMDTGPK